MPGPIWERDGRDWPNRAASAFVHASGLRWHVQRMGQGPTILLIHGTGAATHTWRVLMPRLAASFDVVAPDLPGHGFTQPLPTHRLSLPGMARAVGDLMRAMGVAPVLAAGHSAGAAVLARMALDGTIAPRALVSLNGAFLPFEGLAGHIFHPLAKLFFLNPLVPRVFSWSADERATRRLIRDTGSSVDAAGVEFYRRLLRRPGHVSAALGMMANWDLNLLLRDLPRLDARLVLVAAAGDRAVPPTQAERVRAMVPGAVVERLSGVGHLAHEERPEAVAELVERHARSLGVLPDP